jgi:hypothetical protein
LVPLHSIIGDYTSTDAEIEAYQHAHVKIPEIGENGEYILEDGTPLRQYGLLNKTQAFTSNWQVLGYKHQAVNMGAWDEDSEGDEWPNIEGDGM